MKLLPTHLHRHGVFYDQAGRTDEVALYSLSYTDGGAKIGFDVFKVLRMGARVFQGNPIPPYEQFPPDSMFGSRAWSFTTEKTALEKFNELTDGAPHNGE